MLSDSDLMRLHVEALFTLDEGERLVAVNDPSRAPAPRFFLGRTASGNAWWFRHDVGPGLIEELETLCRSRPAGLGADTALDAPFIDCLARHGPVEKTWAGPAFRFPADLPGGDETIGVTSDNAAVLSPYLEPWLPDVALGIPIMASLKDGKAVSICASVRVTHRAHEAGVETHSGFRGRGHGARAVSAWAQAVRDLDRVPLYSTSWENASSRALANKLGLVQFGADLHIE